MKQKPAFAEEEDPKTGEAILGTESSASFSLPPEQSRERRRAWRKSESDFTSDSESLHLGPLVALLKQSNEASSPAIIAGKNEDTVEAWRECENSGAKFWLFSQKDTVINGESKTYIAREILLAKEGGDLDHENPNLIVAQRKYTANGKVSLEAHRISFRGKPDMDRPYIFPKLGDEIPGVGFPDIHITFRAVRDWQTVLKGARFVGYDRTVNIEITSEDMENKKQIVFDIEKNEMVDSDVKPALGVSIPCADFKPIFSRFNLGKENSVEATPSPQSKKRKMVDTTLNLNENSKAIELKLIGMGPQIDGALRADLNLRLVLKI